MFTIKIIGVLLVVVTCSFIGTLKSRALFERRKKLLLVLDGVNMLHAYIDQGEFELHIAINNAFSKCIFLRFCEDKILCEDEDLKNDNNHYFIAKINDEIVAYLAISYLLDTADIISIVVAKKHTKKGIASLLLNYFFNFCKER